MIRAAASPHLKARMAGGCFLFSVAAAVSGEFFVHGKLAIVLGLIAVVFYFAVTILIYMIFKSVNRNLALLALSSAFAGLALEAVRWNPGGVDVAMVLHGIYCLLIGYLIVRCAFLPRILGALIAFAGLLWLINLSPGLANSLAYYTLVLGLLGEGLPYLWLLVFGLSHRSRHESSASASPSIL